MRTRPGLGALSHVCITGLIFGSMGVARAVPVELTDFTVPYTQDFDGLAKTTGVSATSPVPVGWAFLEAGSNANATYTVGTGSGTAGETYSFGATDATDRAFGSLSSGNLRPTTGASFVNKSGQTIHSLRVSYTGEQWRLGAIGREDRLDFSWSQSASALNTPQATANWVTVSALNFKAPITTGTVGALNGNSAAARTVITHTLTGLSIAPDATFWIRWADIEATEADDGLAVDDFSLTVNAATLPLVDFSKNYRVLADPIPTSGSVVDVDLSFENGLNTGGSGDLQSLRITDTIPSGLTALDVNFVVDLGSGPVTLTTARDGDAGEIISGVLAVDVVTVAANQVILIRYQATINTLSATRTLTSKANATFASGTPSETFSASASDSFDAFVTGHLSFLVWFDTNANGVVDGGETGLPDWKLSVTARAIVTTANDGLAVFAGLLPGAVDVVVEAAAADGVWSFTDVTTATVVGGVTTPVLIAVTCSCTDNDACTTPDSCDRGVCSFGGPPDCGPTDDPCVVNTCNTATGCEQSFTTATCEDNDDTTRDDTCAAGVCAGTPIICALGQCEATSTPNGTDCDVTYKASGDSCDDGSNATGQDACDATGGCAGTAILCTTTQCEATSTPNGTDCDVTYKASGDSCVDGSNATGQDVCDGSGACAGAAISCTVGQCELTSTPNGTDCDVTYKSNTASCDDSNLATSADLCDGAGACAGTAIVCNASQCEATSTPNGTGCDVTYKANTTSCDDANPATGSDLCNGTGTCAGTAIVCTTSQCEATSTANGTDCTVTYKSDTTSCDDGSNATGQDVCDGIGTCAGTAIICTATQCQESSTANGEDCTIVNKGNTVSCDDGDDTTGSDSCNGEGLCVGVDLTCTPTQCQATSTPNGTGCDVTYKSNSTSCDDSNLGTGNDLCDGAGACAGTAITCTTTQCEATSTPNGTGCDVTYKANTTSCDDANPATGSDLCNGTGTCAGTAIVCTTSQCEATSTANGTDCTVTYKSDTTSCDDGSNATGQDVCDGAGACAGTAITCTANQCEATSAPNGTNCTVTYKSNSTSCDDSNLGTGNDLCDGAGACVGTAITCTTTQCEATSTPNGTGCDVTFKPNTTSCDDSNLATGGDLCDGAGVCAGTAITCTTTQCEATSTPNGTGCDVTFKPNATGCDDGLETTSDDVCNGIGTCSGTPILCAPTQCEATSAPDGDGCNVTFKASGVGCDDGSNTTGQDVCNGTGVCAGTAITCTSTQCDATSTPNGTDCTLTFKASGVGCDDSSDTTGQDACDGAGVCAGTAITCTTNQCEATSTPNGTDCDVTYKPNTTSCDDGSNATSQDTCDGTGTCVGTAITCTTTQCEATSTPNGEDCSVTYKASGDGCDDGSSATGQDACDGAGTCAGTAITCTTTQCDESSTPNGTDCDVTYKSDTTSCDDGLTTTGGDMCDGTGLCAGTGIVCDATQCEATSTPNGTDCDVTFKPNATSCDDGLATTGDDICDGAGACAGTPILCAPSQCEATSTPDGDGCAVTYKASGEGCDDSSDTTGQDACDGAGVCAGTMITCTTTQCEETSTPNGTDCDVTYKSDATSCDDDDLATGDDTCDGAGVCAGTVITCTTTQCETTSTPNGTGCDVTYKPNATSCDDADLATGGDICNGTGTCAGTAITCTTTQCEATSTPNGTDCDVTYKSTAAGCDDGLATTNGDACDGAGACAGNPYSCDPSDDPCLQNVQDGTGCTLMPANDGGTCDDGLTTTQNDVCDDVGGCAGEAYNCVASGDPCLDNIQDGTDCALIPTNEGGSCDDGFMTTQNDVCDAFGGCAGEAYNCEPSGSACSENVQDGTNCTAEPINANGTCDDGDTTTRLDRCNSTASCVGSPYSCTVSTNPCRANVQNGTACSPEPTNVGGTCNDNDAATRDDVCDAIGVCVGETITCEVLETLCMVNVANGTDCTPTPANTGGVCDDADDATRNDVCLNDGTCVGDTFSCDAPADVCKVSTPDGSTCVESDAPDGGDCDDDDDATRIDSCVAGVCVGTAFTCEPGLCEATSAANGDGCDVTYEPAATACDDGDTGTKTDVCDGAGACSGTAFTCEPGPCEATSVPNGVDCSVTFKAEASSCDDGNACTTNNLCSDSGLCQGEAVVCADGATCDIDGECVPTHCASCEADSECGESSTCNDLGGETGKVCLLTCELDEDCAEEQVCRDLGESGMFCFDFDGACEAPPVEPGPDAEVEVGPEAVESEIGPEAVESEIGPEVVEAGPDSAAEVGEIVIISNDGGCSGGAPANAGFMLLALLLLALRFGKRRLN